MRQLIIENFKFGLDDRRSALTSKPGVLAKLENAHINPGGEVQKRKAFVRQANVLTGTFGLEATQAGLVVFNGDPTNVPTPLPAGVSCISLVHPIPYKFGYAAYSAAVHALTAVVFSNNYNGLAFVAARFADGNTFCYYGTTTPAVGLGLGTNPIGELVLPSSNGLVLATAAGVAATNAQLASLLADQFGTLGTDWVTTVDGLGDVDVKSPTGIRFVPVPSDTSANGTLAIAQNSFDYPGVVQAAAAGFQVTSNTTPFTVAAPGNSNGSSIVSTTFVSVSRARAANVATIVLNTTQGLFTNQVVTISGMGGSGYNTTAVITVVNTTTISYYTSTAGSEATTADVGGAFKVLRTLCFEVPHGATAAATAALVAASIAASNDATGYTAFASGDAVFINSPPEWGNFTGTVIVLCKASGTISTGTSGSIVLTVTANKSTLETEYSIIYVNGIPFPKNVTSGTVNCTVQGGTPPYHVQWQYVDTVKGNGVGIDIGNPSSLSTNFSFQAKAAGPNSAHFACVVTDSAATPVTSSVQVLVLFAGSIA